MCRKDKSRIGFSVCMALFVVLFALSCSKNDVEEQQKEHDNKLTALKQQNGFLESDALGSTGIYFKYTDDSHAAEVVPTIDDYLIISANGSYSDGLIFTTTDSAVAQSEGIYRSDIVYGPAKLKLNYSLAGFQVALAQMKENSQALMLFPANYAYGGYEPVLFNVKMHRVIRYDSVLLYENQQLNAYRQMLGIAVSDTLPNMNKAYSLITQQGDSLPDLVVGDAVEIKLYAYYAEADSNYIDISATHHGRQFFPINQSGDIIRYVYGATFFPLSPVVDSVLYRMKVGEKRDVVANSIHGYGAEGFWHPLINIAIVPGYTPLHYTIELREVVKSE